MAKQSKYESEYTRLRDNIMQKQRRMLNKGYFLQTGKEKISLPTFKQLKSAPSARDIKKLENILHKKIYDIYSYEIRYTEIGHTKTVSAKEAIKYMRSQAAKKGAETKRRKKEFDKWVEEQYNFGGDFYEPEYNENLPSPTSEESQEAKDWLEKEEDFPEEYDLPFTDENVDTSESFQHPDFEQDIILIKTRNEIMRLYNFVSADKNKKRGEKWEKFLFDCGEELMNIFNYHVETHKDLFALRLYNDADNINYHIGRLIYAYLTKEDPSNIMAELISIFEGTVTVAKAMEYSNKYDQFDTPIDITERTEGLYD